MPAPVRIRVIRAEIIETICHMGAPDWSVANRVRQHQDSLAFVPLISAGAVEPLSSPV